MKRFALIALVVLLACATALAEERKPKEEYVKITEAKWKLRPNDGTYYWASISGKIKNISEYSFSAVLLEFSIFDSRGVKISIVQKAGILNLKPGDVAEWTATPPICALPDSDGRIPYRYRLDSIRYAFE